MNEYQNEGGREKPREEPDEVYENCKRCGSHEHYSYECPLPAPWENL